MRILQTNSEQTCVKAVLAAWNDWIDSLSTVEIRSWPDTTQESLISDILEFNRVQSTKVKDGSWALKSLRKITLALVEESHQVSGFHVIFLDFAISSNNPTCALELLHHPITTVSKKSKVSDFLLYHYYGGIIFLSQRMRELGLEYLKRVLIVPAQIPSQIQINAFKKLILTALLLDGKFVPFKSEKSHVPLYTSPVLRQVLKTEGSAYFDFAKVFETLDPVKIQESFKKYFDIFQRQGNLGLVKQVLQSYFDHLLKKKAKVYSRIYFHDLEKESWVTITRDSMEKLTRSELECFLSNSATVLIDDRSDEIKFEVSETKMDYKEIMDRLSRIGTKFYEWNKALCLSEDSRTGSKNDLESTIFDDRMDMEDLMNL